MFKLSKNSNELTITIPMEIVNEAMSKGVSSLNIKLNLESDNKKEGQQSVNYEISDNYPSQSGIEALSMRF